MKKGGQNGRKEEEEERGACNTENGRTISGRSIVMLVFLSVFCHCGAAPSRGEGRSGHGGWFDTKPRVGREGGGKRGHNSSLLVEELVCVGGRIGRDNANRNSFVSRPSCSLRQQETEDGETIVADAKMSASIIGLRGGGERGHFRGRGRGRGRGAKSFLPLLSPLPR
eukprot:18988-Rhodomonas_salina.2